MIACSSHFSLPDARQQANLLGNTPENEMNM
jgi:hypothetical protein